MIDYLFGSISELSPTYVVLEVNSIGYFINISISTYENLQGKNQAKIYVHLIIREDSFSLYGFSSTEEREIFRLLISVSGVGAATARLMLSSLKPDEIRTAILTNDVQLIKSVKGIGLKTAQRIIVDLKDKIDTKSKETVLPTMNTNRTEAVEALVTLGFSKKSVEKVVNNILKKTPQATVEQIIKEAFKFLT